MTEQDKTYEAVVEVLLPSNSKSTAYKLAVRAGDPIEAMAKAIDEWNAAVIARDIRIREVSPVIVA
jgi:fatty acid-binding protein DegV